MRKNQPNLLHGALVGLLFTVPLISLFYLANQVVGLPYVPFDLFEWLSRILPGDLVVFGIDTMVKILTFFSLSVREASKPAEILMALGQFTVIGIVMCAVFYFVLRRWAAIRKNYLVGMVLGVVAGIVFLLISFQVGKYSASPEISAIWVLLVFILWGVAMQWSYQKLVREEAPEVVAGEASVASFEMQQIDRRKFLVMLGGASAVITVIGAGLGSLIKQEPQQVAAGGAGEGGIDLQVPEPQTVTLPERPGAVEPVPGTRPEYTPLEDHYRIDINLTPPEIDGATWHLPIQGLVSNPITLNLNDFYQQRYGEPMHLFVTLACISNNIAGDLVSTTRWTGVSLQRILDEVEPLVSARHLNIESADGFYESVPLDLIRSDERIMLTYLWDGKPLLPEHGYPLRIYIPDRYGMKQPKWITNFDLSAVDQPGYWVERGWDRIAQMKATSVIDVVGVDEVIQRGGQDYIPVGGIARAGARGISKVEVQVDDGDWQEAQLRTPLSELTWVLWRFEWPFEAGDHTFTVRCYDGAGEMQITESHPPHPSGATGLHNVEVSV
ncbi:MAG: molybdopterin-dependent oxidoreductase [Anaerolineales bacterium]|jgi:DMSO/TMAO reductase YedYZ molybdopterin-dependent catalytic subunit